MKSVPASCALFVFILVALGTPAAAFSHEYIVEPAFGSVGTAAPDVVPINFLDLNLREMVIIGALALSPSFVFPVEIFFTLKLLACLGFRRIGRRNILASSIRNTLYTTILLQPGISFVELLQEIGLSRGALTYHITLMRISGKIVLLESPGITSYFENSDRYTPGEREVLKYLRQETERRILLTLARNPLMSRRDFEQILGVSGPTVTWHMKRLIDAGLMSHHKEGRFARYALSERTLVYLKKYCEEIPLLPEQHSCA
ncbi:winged helix-turn-helix transcriptional regulator [Methanoregula sp.]|uniref:winged helix-turn-helix transcriptional regulator n=1 Tax=Methanoregula sp. TaxID=2052170 RepID=UPI00356A9B71